MCLRVLVNVKPLASVARARVKSGRAMQETNHEDLVFCREKHAWFCVNFIGFEKIIFYHLERSDYLSGRFYSLLMLRGYRSLF